MDLLQISGKMLEQEIADDLKAATEHEMVNLGMMASDKATAQEGLLYKLASYLAAELGFGESETANAAAAAAGATALQTATATAKFHGSGKQRRRRRYGGRRVPGGYPDCRARTGRRCCSGHVCGRYRASLEWLALSRVSMSCLRT